jgi:hypothetical protein
MTMILTTKDVEDLLLFAGISAACIAKVEQVACDSVTSISESVLKTDPSVGKILQDFLSAYRDWYAFVEQIDSEERNGELSQSETEELILLSKARDQTREDLLRIVSPRDGNG